MTSSNAVSEHNYVLVYECVACGLQLPDIESAELHKSDEEVYKMIREGKLEFTLEDSKKDLDKHPLGLLATVAAPAVEVKQIQAPVAVPVAAPAKTTGDPLAAHLARMKAAGANTVADRLQQHLESMKAQGKVKEKATPLPTTPAPAQKPQEVKRDQKQEEKKDTLTLTCSWCACHFLIKESEIACKVLRHAQFKSGDFCDPHTPEVVMRQLKSQGVVNGCGNPLRIEPFEGKYRVVKGAWSD